MRTKQALEPIAGAWIRSSSIVEVTAAGTREAKPFHATLLFLTSLRTTQEALLRQLRDRWSIEGWHWIRDTRLHEDAHRYGGNGAAVLEALETAAVNLFRLNGFHSTRKAMQAVVHNIAALLPMVQQQPGRIQCRYFDRSLRCR